MRRPLSTRHSAWIFSVVLSLCLCACSEDEPSSDTESDTSGASDTSGSTSGTSTADASDTSATDTAGTIVDTSTDDTGIADTSDTSTTDTSPTDTSPADTSPSDTIEDTDTHSGGRPHPLYQALDLDTLPGDGGAADGPYEPPALPTTTREVNVTSTGNQARADLLAACQTPGTAVTVPDAAGTLGALDFGNVQDCDVTLGPNVTVNFIYVGHLPGPTVAPTHRLRVRGGQVGSIIVDPGSSDIVFDGVTLNNAILPSANRSGTAIYLIDDPVAGTNVNRFAFVNSIIRMMPTLPSGSGDTDGCAYLAANARNVFFANNNIVTAGNRNAWGFRIGGGANFIAVDNTVRVAFHKLIRMNDGPVDYVFAKGGTWMREATLTAGGLALNDAFVQLGDLGTDNVFIQDTSVYLLSPEPVSFGASFGPGQVGKRWEARRISWFALSASVVSDAHLTNLQSGCASGATCDYGVGTHTYTYDANLSFPPNPWRTLPSIPQGNPDTLPVAP